MATKGISQSSSATIGNNQLVAMSNLERVVDQQNQHMLVNEQHVNYSFHNSTMVNHQHGKKKKRKALEGCNHFKITTSGVDENIHPALIESKKKKKLNPTSVGTSSSTLTTTDVNGKVQVSSFDVLSMTNNNAMFGVFKKKPSQHSYETVLMFGGNSKQTNHINATTSPKNNSSSTLEMNLNRALNDPIQSSNQSTSPQPPLTQHPLNKSSTSSNNSNQTTLIMNSQSKELNQQLGSIQQPSSVSFEKESSRHLQRDNATLQNPTLSTHPILYISSPNNFSRPNQFQTATDLLFSEKQNSTLSIQQTKTVPKTNNYRMETHLPRLSSIVTPTSLTTIPPPPIRTALPSLKDLLN